MNQVLTQKTNPVAFAQLWLGRRFSERPLPDGSTSYFLDGSPTSLNAFMLEANRAAAKAGKDMVEFNRRWIPR